MKNVSFVTLSEKNRLRDETNAGYTRLMWIIIIHIIHDIYTVECQSGKLTSVYTFFDLCIVK